MEILKICFHIYSHLFCFILLNFKYLFNTFLYVKCKRLFAKLAWTHLCKIKNIIDEKCEYLRALWSNIIGLEKFLENTFKFDLHLGFSFVLAIIYYLFYFFIKDILSKILVLDWVDGVPELMWYHSINHSQKTFLKCGQIVFDMCWNINYLNLFMTVQNFLVFTSLYLHILKSHMLNLLLVLLQIILHQSIWSKLIIGRVNVHLVNIKHFEHFIFN